MRKVRLPKRSEDLDKIENYYTLEELKHFFKCVDDYGNPKMAIFFRLLAFTGARKSEVLALQWEDIDFNAKTLDITKTVSLDESERPIVTTPKTKKSIRKISLDDGTLDELKKWRKQQAEYYLKHGYNTMHPGQLIVPSKTNGLYNPTFPNDWLNMLARKFDFKRITLHGFRHTHCSLLFEMGTPLEEVRIGSAIPTSKRR